jgi:hypothetical protein
MMNNYQAKREQRIENLRAAGEQLVAKGTSATEAAREIRSHIPAGQPILVGHHSEKRHRRDIERNQALDRRGFDEQQAGKELVRRADAAENNTAISSDDPDAIELLEAKLVEVTAERDREVAGNKAIRAAKGDMKVAAEALLALGFSVKQAARALTPDYGDKVYGFAVKNATAVVRATEKRIEELRAKAAAPERAPLVIGDVIMAWSKEENRVQLQFPGRVSTELYSELRSCGFKATSTIGLWQRHASNAAWYSGEQVMKHVATAPLPGAPTA